MHLKALKVFCDVVARRSFSRAAADNGMTQSGASQIVNGLEQYLGVKLIDRSKRPFVLTRAGEVYYRGCRDVVRQLYALQEKIQTLEQEVQGRVGIASIYSVGLTHINRCVRAFLSAHSKANIHIEYHHPDRVYELVEAGQVDIGLVSYPKQSRTMRATAWLREPFVVACSGRHGLAARMSVRMEELNGLEMVGFSDGLRIRREIDRFLSRHDVEVRVTSEFDNIETLKRAVEVNAGFSLLPVPTFAREAQLGTLVGVPLADAEFFRPVGILRRRGVEFGGTAQRFMEFLNEYAESDGPGTACTELMAGGAVDTVSAGPTYAGAENLPTVAHSCEK